MEVIPVRLTSFAQGDHSWEVSCIVPKKPNEMKADLQNSTVSQGDDHL